MKDNSSFQRTLESILIFQFTGQEQVGSEHGVHMIGKVARLRAIRFSLFCGDSIVAEGEISAMEGNSLSCFGAYQEFPVIGTEETAGFFVGAVIEHDLRADGSVGLRLRLYGCAEDSQSPCGYRQVLQFRSAMTIGIDAGVSELESVNLVNHHFFEFESRVQA